MINKCHPMGKSFKKLLKEQRPITGIFSGLNAPFVIEMAAYAEFDFVIIDNEHGTSGYESTENLLRTANSCDICAVVRSLPQDVSRLLDAGASAIQIPMIESSQQARQLVNQFRYPPDGTRGVAFSSRAAGYGAFGGAGHVEKSNSEIAFIAMIETPEGVKNAYEIANVDGVDAIFIGPNDLSNSHGYGPAWREKPTMEIIEKIIQEVKRANKPVGILALDANDKSSFVSMGADYCVTVASTVFTKALQSSFGELSK